MMYVGANYLIRTDGDLPTIEWADIYYGNLRGVKACNVGGSAFPPLPFVCPIVPLSVESDDAIIMSVCWSDVRRMTHALGTRACGVFVAGA